MIDATVVRAHPCAAGAPKKTGMRRRSGRSRGGFSSKLHVLVDALGNPLKYILTSGAAGGQPRRPSAAGGHPGARKSSPTGGYDADKTLAYIEQDMGPVATIPPKKSRTVQRDCDYAAYRERHLVECLIGKLKHFRRVFRPDK
ncbi:MAG: hypothetical protein U0841_08445 [Chloroflexia bacterium]